MLAGPKQERWFSAETFIALSHAAQPVKDNEILPDFSCWGEEQFSTLFAKLQVTSGIVEGIRRRPDVVCYLPDEGELAIDAILELKLILNAEKPESALTELKAQLLNARRLGPKSKVLGLIFLAAAPLITPGTFERAIQTARSAAECVLPDSEGFSWVSGHTFACVFQGVPTDFHYPSMSVSLALGVRELTAHAASGGPRL